MTNLLVIVADDMRFDHLPFMASVRTLLQEPGRSFVTARCNVALCQPNRVSFFTGQNSRDNGEVGVGLSGVHFDDHDHTVGLALHAAGYRCGLFGKYVNFYDEFGGIDPPKGWDVWREFARERTVIDFKVRRGAETEDVVGTFQSEFLAAEAVEFVRGPEPWFCYLAPKQPHAPFAPHPDDLHAWSDRTCRIVDFDDEAMASKPFWMHDLPQLTEADKARTQQDFRGRLRELSAVDRMIDQVVTELDRLHRLDDTVIVFTSDNGEHQGEQRRLGDGTKGGPYDVGLRVPLVVRGPGFEPGPDITVPVYPAADVTATLLDVAGARPALPHQAGTSLRRIVREADQRAFTQRVLLHEVGEGFPITGDGLTTGPDHEMGYWKAFRYPSHRTDRDGPFIWELYDLAEDPDEITSLAKSGKHLDLLVQFGRMLDQMLA